jgi:hypothetical protein
MRDGVRSAADRRRSIGRNESSVVALCDESMERQLLGHYAGQAGLGMASATSRWSTASSTAYSALATA